MTDEKKCPCDTMLEAQNRLQEHERRLYDGNTNFALIEQKLATIEEDTCEIKSDLKELKDKPAQRWDSAVNTVINVILAAIVAFLLSKNGI